MMKRFLMIMPLVLGLCILFGTTKAQARVSVTGGDGGIDEVEDTPLDYATLHDAVMGEAKDEYEDLSGIEKGAYNLFEYLLEPPSSVNDFLKVSQSDADSLFNNSGSNGLYELMKVVATYLLIIYLLLEVDKLVVMSSNDFNMKGLFMLLLKYTFGWFLVQNLDVIIGGIFGLNNAMVDVIAGSKVTQSALDNARKTMAAIQEQTLFETIGMLLSLCIAVLGAAVGNIMVAFHAVSRKIELMLRGLFAPLAVADTFKGLDSTGIRYIKKFAACALLGAGILAVLQVGSSLSASIIARAFDTAGDDVSNQIGTLSFLFQLVVIPLSMGGAISAVKQVCNDALGC